MNKPMRLLSPFLSGTVLACLVGACLDFGGGSGGSTAGGGNTAPIPLPPNGGATDCLDEPSASCADTTSIETYGACVLGQCDSAYGECFGPGYASGLYGGDCADWATCVSACVACDATCLASCKQQHATRVCTLCMTQKVQPCVATAARTGQCAVPCSVDAGATGTSPGYDAGGVACAALRTCCFQLPLEDSTSCQTALAQAGGVDASCSYVLSSYQAAGQCP
jgi:hypothetical protein